MRSLLFFFFLFFLPISNMAIARELPSNHWGTIPLAMGGAYSAVADDWLSLHYNPAGLALQRKLEFQLLNFSLDVNRTSIEHFKNIRDLKGDQSIQDIFDLIVDRPVNLGTSVLAQFTAPKFALSTYYRLKGKINLLNSVFPKTTITYMQDFGVVGGIGIGIGKPMVSNRQKPLRLGFSLQHITRRGGTKKIGLQDLIGPPKDLLKKFQAKGVGTGITLGTQYQLPIRSRQEYTVALVYHNVGRTSFGKFTDRERPEPEEENITIGVAARFPFGAKTNRRAARRHGYTRSVDNLTIALDYSHLNVSTDKEPFPKHFHFGANLSLPFISIQAGFNQLYFTMGASVDIGIARISLLTYKEEIGAHAGQDGDRRYLFSTTIKLGSPTTQRNVANYDKSSEKTWREL